MIAPIKITKVAGETITRVHGTGVTRATDLPSTQATAGELSRPIIIIGTGRCGSTVFFEALSRHENLGWLTNYDTRLPNSNLAQLTHYVRRSNLLDQLLVTEKLQSKSKWGFGEKFLIRPEEGYAKWNMLCGHEFGKDFLLNREASPKAIKRIHDFFRTVLRKQSKSRLLIKITGPTRMEFLNSIFPDARFIHVVRDPCAVASSLMKTGFWQSSLDKPRWQNGLTEEWESEWEWYGRSPLALIAIQYRAIMEICYHELRKIGTERYLELTYQQFVENPVETMTAAMEWADLVPSQRVSEFVGSPSRYKNMNYKYRECLSSDQIKMIREIALQDNQTIALPEN